MVETARDWRLADFRNFLIAKEALDISEYEVFYHAYREWYGHEPNSASLEALFGGYLRSHRLPHFVKHYARRFVATHPEHVQSMRERRWQSQRANFLALGTLAILVISALSLT